ncbi:DUF3261 domain-containing protein [Dongia sp. agr-C8]
MPDVGRLRACFLGLLLGLLAGCATTSESSRSKVDIAPGVTLTLPDRPPFGRDANAVQLVQAVYRDRKEVFQAVIASNEDGLTLIMTVPNGPRIMSLEWREDGLKAKYESIAPNGLTAEHMLADIMTVYAPPEALRRALGGAELAVKPDGSRELTRDGRPIARVTYATATGANPWNGRTVLENLAFGYRLAINSQPTQP